MCGCVEFFGGMYRDGHRQTGLRELRLDVAVPRVRRLGGGSGDKGAETVSGLVVVPRRFLPGLFLFFKFG